VQKWQKYLLLACIAVLLVLGGFAGWRVWRVSDFSRLCLAAEKKQDWPALEQLSREWSRLEPEEAVAWYWLGKSLQAQSRYEESVEAFQHVQISEPRGFDAAIAQMQILFQLLHKPAEAIEIADRLLEADPGLPDPRRYRIYFLAMTLQRGNLLKEIREAIRYRADLPDHYIYLMTLEDLIFRDGDVVTHNWLQRDPDN
jgi:tetratricopeptide (TPR) repeat protein